MIKKSLSMPHILMTIINTVIIIGFVIIGFAFTNIALADKISADLGGAGHSVQFNDRHHKQGEYRTYSNRPVKKVIWVRGVPHRYSHSERYLKNRYVTFIHFYYSSRGHVFTVEKHVRRKSS